MKHTIYTDRTEVFPSDEEMRTICRPGQGADTCIWLVVGTEFECTFFNKHPIMIDRFEKDETVSKRNGCNGDGKGPELTESQRTIV